MTRKVSLVPHGWDSDLPVLPWVSSVDILFALQMRVGLDACHAPAQCLEGGVVERMLTRDHCSRGHLCCSASSWREQIINSGAARHRNARAARPVNRLDDHTAEAGPPTKPNEQRTSGSSLKAEQQHPSTTTNSKTAPNNSPESIQKLCVFPNSLALC